MESFRAFVSEIGQQELAKRLGCSPALVSHWVTGRKRVSEKQALRIERESCGRVRVEELRPDVPWDVIRGNAVTGKAAA
ncbi:MAG TPA: YdaS family helix-turn-helix protein [Rhodocyclaceae bacterium]